ncbi:hypothetical protein BKA80DRAFT_276984 [Phyllosticta citrichinensis]
MQAAEKARLGTIQPHGMHPSRWHDIFLLCSSVCRLDPTSQGKGARNLLCWLAVSAGGASSISYRSQTRWSISSAAPRTPSLECPDQLTSDGRWGSGSLNIHDTQLHLRGFPRLGRWICEMDALGTMHARSLLACPPASQPPGWNLLFVSSGLVWCLSYDVSSTDASDWAGRLASAWPALRHDRNDDDDDDDVGPVQEARTQKANRSKHSSHPPQQVARVDLSTQTLNAIGRPAGPGLIVFVIPRTWVERRGIHKKIPLGALCDGVLLFEASRAPGASWAHRTCEGRPNGARLSPHRVM